MKISKELAQKLNNKVKEVVELVAKNKVVSVTGQQMTRCLESDPCCGHGGALIELDSGQILKVDGDSVEIAAIQKALAPRPISHFAKYVINWEYKE